VVWKGWDQNQHQVKSYEEIQALLQFQSSNVLHFSSEGWTQLAWPGCPRHEGVGLPSLMMYSCLEFQ
jgi:hypothetical protein